MVATTAGWVGDVEVVEVEFDPRVLAYRDLLQHAIAADCAIRVFTRNDAHQTAAASEVGERAVRFDGAIRVVEDQKYWLGRTELKYVPMTETQAARINADVKRAERWLSPRQLELLRDAKRNPRPRASLIDVPLVEGWSRLQTR